MGLTIGRSALQKYTVDMALEYVNRRIEGLKHVNILGRRSENTASISDSSHTFRKCKGSR